MTITLESAIAALKTIRDEVVTDQNLTTVKEVVDQIQEMVLSIYGWVTSTPLNPDEVALEAEKEGVKEDVALIIEDLSSEEPEFQPYIPEEPVESAEDADDRGFSLAGMIEAVKFIKGHLKTSDNILTDLISLFAALDTVKFYSEQQTEDRGTPDIEREGLLDIYTQITG